MANKQPSKPFEFLVFSVWGGDATTWHAFIEGRYFGPCDTKAELMDEICETLSLPKPRAQCATASK